MERISREQEIEKKEERFILDVLENEKEKDTRVLSFSNLSQMKEERENVINKIYNKFIDKGKNKINYQKALESLSNYFYVKDPNDLESGDFIRYFNFDDLNNIKLTHGAKFIGYRDGYLILKNSKVIINNNEPKIWKIKSSMPVFCVLSETDTIKLCLQELVSSGNTKE